MRLVVIGGVAAGLSAASRARRLDPHLDIVVLEKGSTISYSACGLPHLIAGIVPHPENLQVYTPQFFRTQRRIDVRTNCEVVAIRHSSRQVVLQSGEKLAYDRLIIATGSRPKKPELDIEPGAPVFYLHTLDDAIKINDYLASHSPKKAVVLGAGYIGLELAEALRRRGLAVTVLESSADVLHRNEPLLTHIVQEHLKKFGIELLLNTRAQCVHRNGVDQIPADMVVVATGITPNVELAQEAGVRLGQSGAIAVDEFMQTNLHGVYAAGDCAEAYHRILARPVHLPLGTTANKMGRVAGANAAGRRERFHGVVGTAVVKICDLEVGFTGLSVAQTRSAGFRPVAVTIEANTRPKYYWPSKLTVQLIADRTTAKLLGATIIGEEAVLARLNTIAAALFHQMTVEEFSFLDLGYNPPVSPVWDPVLIAAQQLLHEL